MRSSVEVTGRVGYAQVIGSAAGGAANAGWFGDGRDGDLVVTGDTPLEVAIDEGQILKQYNNLTVQKGGVLRPANRCNGMILLIKGDLTVEGTISVDKCAPLLNAMEETAVKEMHIVLCGALKGGNGGKGGDGSAAGGAGGNGHAFGGGFPGGGGAYALNDGHNGSWYTPYPGGAGEPRPPHGITWPYPATAKGASLYGAGGSVGGIYGKNLGGSAPGGSSAYNPGSDGGSNGLPGDGYPGGALWIFVKGKVRIGGTGLISANGGNGANSTGTYQRSAAGGGAGGGIVALIHTGDYVNEGSVVANGGSSGSTGQQGTPGVNGSVGTILVSAISELM